MAVYKKLVILHDTIMIIIRLIRESYLFAIQALVGNKLRTILSLLGITIGIFAIIFVLTTVDSMEKTIRDSMQSLGRNTIFVQKWPWGFGGEYEWWEYMNRPRVNYDEMKELKDRVNGELAMAFMASANRTVKYRGQYVENTRVMGISHDYNKIENLAIQRGRYFTPSESRLGANVIILGYDLAKGLFPRSNPVGKELQVFGRRLTVIGFIEKKGINNFGMSPDQQAYIPVSFLEQVIDIRYRDAGQAILTQPAENVMADMFIGELNASMRAIRSLKPGEKDNFAINEVDVASQNLSRIFGTVSAAGWFIGLIAIFVGGFGIANIMFVSVRERTNIIGIQKALGAKNYFIMLQFLFEAVILSLIGGLLGLFFVWLITLILADVEIVNVEFTLYLNQANIFLGLIVSVIVGVVAGIVPAWSASRLDPVEAIRTN